MIKIGLFVSILEFCTPPPYLNIVKISFKNHEDLIKEDVSTQDMLHSWPKAARLWGTRFQWTLPRPRLPMLMRKQSVVGSALTCKDLKESTPSDWSEK